jgi:phage terminase large subunit
MQVNFSSDIFNKKFYALLKNQSRHLVLYGGAGSGKSIFAGQKILFRMLSEKNHRFVMVRKIHKTIRNSQFKMLLDLIDKYNLEHLFSINKTEMSISCPYTKSEIIAVGVDNPEKVKSLVQITGMWYEEPTELTPEDFRQMSIRMRGKTNFYKQEILTFNPISEHHWLVSEFFPLAIRQALKKNVNNIANLIRRTRVGKILLSLKATIMHSTYLDNAFLEVEDKAILEELKYKDYNYYRIYCLGEWGVLGNLVYENGFEILKKYPTEFEETFYGLDFGYHHPATLIKVQVRDGKYYTTELLCETKLTNTQLLNEIQEEGLIENINDIIYADCAEPDRIKEFDSAGFNIKPAYKAKNSVKDGIDFIKSQAVYSIASNIRLNREATCYKWREDKYGKPLDEVVKYFDDMLDALRYAIYTHSKESTVKFAFVG